jgi:transcriptional regulator with XRE-family HTH domain
MELHESIRAARQRKKMSGAVVAKHLDMSAGAYRRYERGEVVPSATTILELAGLLDCSATALMLTGGLEEEPPPRNNIQQLDLELREGETMQIVINATVKPAAIRPQPNGDTYKPRRLATERRQQALKKA